MRRWRNDDFLHDDMRRECIHGNYKKCSECEAEVEAYWRAERYKQRCERAAWFIAGVMFLMIVETTMELLGLR